ncbi:MAG: ABC-type transport auxiliary lipoprotein family protein, partial [Planctomycetota bacterium JB042]
LRLEGVVLAFEETDDAAVVELGATLVPAEGRLEPATPTRLAASGRAPLPDGDPGARAAAMERALAAASAELAERSVEAVAAARRPDPAAPVRDADPVRLDLVVRPSDPSVGAPGRAVRLGRVDAPSSLDRLDPIERSARHRVRPRPGVVWTKRPSEVVADALADTLRRAVGPAGSVSREGSLRADEVEIGARIRRFEFDATERPAAARVELEVTVDGKSSLLVGRRVPDGDGPDGLAEAFAAAVEEAVGGVPALVGAAPSPADEPRLPPPPVERFLALETEVPAARESSCDLRLGVFRLAGPGGVDRLELAHRDDGHVVALDPALRWERRPAAAATEGLIRALDASGAFPAGVFGPGATSDPDLRLAGAVERFDFERREAERVAVVSLHLELRRGDEVVRFPAVGTAKVPADEPSALAAAMERALSEALEAAVDGTAEAARRLASDD